MKLRIFTLLFIFGGVVVQAQDNLDELLAAGAEDAQRFTEGYITPATEGLLWNTTTGWMNGAKVKKPLGFEFSVFASGTFIKDEQKSFNASASEYNNVEGFRTSDNPDGPLISSLDLATAFGENDPEVVAVINVENALGFEDEVEVILPQGLGAENINILPTAFVQARLGIFKATEVKVRYFPNIEYENVTTGLIGIGLQHEISQWLPGSDVLPFRLSGLVAYTNTTGEYDFTDQGQIEGENQRFELKQNSYTFQLMASTKLPIINFYGGLGYVTGTSEFDILGTYRFRDPTLVIGGERTIEDPISITNDISGIRATVGLKLQLAFFGLHADYNLAEYNTASIGLHFGI